jgi:hypothetical protein
MTSSFRIAASARLVVALALLLGTAAWAQESQSPQASPKPKVAIDLNTATQAQLEALPGVDPAMARRIIAARPYTSVDSLTKADVPPATIEQIRPMVRVSAPGTAAGGAARGAREGAKGVEKGASAAAKGVEKGVAAGTKGGEKGAEAGGGAMKKTREKVTGEAKARRPPTPGMVWVDTATGLYYKTGDHEYGRTAEGKWMIEADARDAGFKRAPEPTKK